ncbi:hypothetical protein RFI_02889 [Reticulomyxa filosa]|uniref:Uncharacterized protein n=1 Tax=Reticulomyxa filosa TaxID=46433 RepID=X6P6N9_RETFI|nr:hypothetical protein RFI_02889 [Reticulomyxa filosa]|eukprot:ETO34205.1 hypothetical protein RFI_02889 [Reticulomyxa filosa]
MKHISVKIKSYQIISILWMRCIQWNCFHPSINLIFYNLHLKIFGFHSNNWENKDNKKCICTINDNSMWKNLKNVKETDVTNFIKLFEQKLKYSNIFLQLTEEVFMSNEDFSTNSQFIMKIISFDCGCFRKRNEINLSFHKLYQIFFFF